ncbi:peroxiredoxin family protein [Singulisphaera rosea]
MQGLTLVLLIVLASEPVGPRTPAVELEAIRDAQTGASQRYGKALGDAKTADERDKAVEEYLNAVVVNADRALDLARRHRDDPSALDALIFVIRTAGAGPSDRSEKAIGMLARDHLRDERIGDACTKIFHFSHLPAAEELDRKVLDRNPSPTARGLACYGLAQYLKEQARMVRLLRENPDRVEKFGQSRGKARIERLVKDKDPSGLEAEAVALLERTASEFGTIKFGRRLLADIANGEVFELRRLKIGDVAPEIDSVDADGKPLRLSDYRGKVIVLTFSGNWCGPCRAMYPQERALVDRLKGKPFAMLSVNTDEDKETLRHSVASGEITWRCWSDGASDGPISTRWGVTGFPTIYVLDTDGVIRFKDIRDRRLDEAVESLLKMTAPEEAS